MSLNNFDEALLSSSEEERMLMENGEDDLDVPKELSIDNIRGMKASIEKNVKDLEEALAEVTTSNEEPNHELINELNLALVQSNLLLEKIVIIEDGYKKAIKTDTLLSQEITDLAEQLGFIVPLHLTKTIEEISESVSPNTHLNNEEEENGLEVREGDYKFVSFDELEKYLNEPLLPEDRNQTPKDNTPQRAAVSSTSTPSTNIVPMQSPKITKSSPPQSSQHSPADSLEGEPVTPITSREKELRKEYLKNSINMSKVSFSSPTSTASIFSTPAVERSDRKNLEGDEYIEITPIVEEENPTLTEEQQQLIEEQDVNNLLEQLMIYTNGLDEAKNSPRNRPLGDLIKDIKEEEGTPQENISSPSIFLRQEGNASPHYTRITPRETPRELPKEIQRELQKEVVREIPRETQRVVESPPKLSATNLENEFMKRDLEDAKSQISVLKQQVEFLQSKVASTEAENSDLKMTIETLYEAKNQFDADMQSIKEKE
ncbi:predicted protein [Naegleria gruberi]|uniref:Predicted protein n=1 Tax=Naegleria gruberi TaxID=5762 RepID=D2V099_NAEGR|nr:uncharacterized protein NAEGRDRAFT_62218 [Naegleria gruberi]EFC49491.1 predicted protein [Naegleria gruberi]|eukprot:XP_002682235.1 predicted protein [Naegleria gruberi strain NEG-M]